MTNLVDRKYMNLCSCILRLTTFEYDIYMHIYISNVSVFLLFSIFYFSLVIFSTNIVNILVSWLIGFILWYINPCGLFHAKSYLYIHMICKPKFVVNIIFKQNLFVCTHLNCFKYCK